jgi:hypothetical protein
MASIGSSPQAPTKDELDHMHEVYRKGGEERLLAPDIVYGDYTCPHTGCGQRMQAIDFRLETYGPAVHDPLVRAWWNDDGFAGRCPHCGGWIHFTIRGKRAVSAAEASLLPQLPDDWHQTALIL